jgi:signal transduction histidine kinase
MKERRWSGVLWWIGQSAAAAAFFVAAVFIASHMSVSNQTAFSTSYYRLSIWDDSDSFLESSFFNRILRDQVQETVRQAVIRMQMETLGEFDPEKMINVSEFVNRRNTLPQNDVSGEFSLEELLYYGETGATEEKVTMSMEDFITYFDRNALNESYYYIEYDTDGKETLAYLGAPREDLDSKEQNALNLLYDETGYKEKLILAYNSIDRTNQKDVSIWDTVGGIDVVFTVYTYGEPLQERNDPALEIAEDDYTMTITLNSEEIAAQEQHQENMDLLYPAINATPGLRDMVDNWTDYFKLQDYLLQASTELWTNYEEYRYYKDGNEGESNLKYVVMDDQNFFGNYSINYQNASLKQMNNVFAVAFPWYMTYPQDYHVTLYGAGDQMISDAMLDYRYAFTNDKKMWIALDTTYPVTTDIFYRAKENYQLITYREEIIALLSILILLWLIMTIFIGHRIMKRSKGQITLLGRVWTEILLALGGCLVLGGMLIYGIVVDEISCREITSASQNYLLLLAGVAGMLFNLIFYVFYAGMLCHIRAKSLWSHSLSGKLVHGSTLVAKRCVKFVAESKNDLIRALVPYILFLLFNLLGVVVAFTFIRLHYADYGVGNIGTGGFVTGMILLGVDIAVGFKLAAKASSRREVLNGIRKIRDGQLSYQIPTDDLQGDHKELAESFNLIGEGIRKAVENSIKDERLKTELITNVSHDIKTPLTSIINYVDLLKREGGFQEPIKGYLDILDAKSQRLKQLTDDLVEASKISSGNYVLNFERLDFAELLHQALGEYAEKLEEKQLPVIFNTPEEPAVIYADSRRMWRVIENLLQNICKYAMPQTRVYMQLTQQEGKVWMSLKNISLQPLNISASELTERFIRGDDSRATEGSGLGLSIAKSLTEAQGGTFTIQLDGDLFKVVMGFDACDHS